MAVVYLDLGLDSRMGLHMTRADKEDTVFGMSRMRGFLGNPSLAEKTSKHHAHAVRKRFRRGSHYMRAIEPEASKRVHINVTIVATAMVCMMRALCLLAQR